MWQPVTGSHQKPADCAEHTPSEKRFVFFRVHVACLQSRLAYARHSAACSLEIIGKQKAADGADITVRVQDRRQMPARNIENLRMVHQSDEILLHFRREEILIGQDEKNFPASAAKSAAVTGFWFIKSARSPEICTSFSCG